MGSQLSPHGLHPRNLLDMKQQGRRTTRQWFDQGKQPLRHDRDVDDLDMHHDGHVNNKTNNCTCGISTGWRRLPVHIDHDAEDLGPADKQ